MGRVLGITFTRGITAEAVEFPKPLLLRLRNFVRDAAGGDASRARNDVELVWRSGAILNEVIPQRRG